MTLLDELAGSVGIKQDIMLRLSPGVDPHTHAKTTTGILDSKFGISIDTGDARQAMMQALYWQREFQEAKKSLYLK